MSQPAGCLYHNCRRTPHDRHHYRSILDRRERRPGARLFRRRCVGASARRPVSMTAMTANNPDRQPFSPAPGDWRECYEMLCEHCALHLRCPILEAMIEMKDGAAWPEGGWVSDPGAGVTCLSYVPRGSAKMPRQQRRQLARMKESELPPVCGGCAARRGTEASVSLHTRRDYQAAVRNGSLFTCHESPDNSQLCGGWCRAIRAKGGKVK